MWLEAQHLFSVVENYAENDSPENAALLLAQLSTFKERLQLITKNKPKCTVAQAKLKPGTEVEVNDLKVELDDAICNEVKIISNAFNMNEIDALQVVLAGEVQTANFGGLPRGLLAVVCYYDIHRFLAMSLQTILRLDPESLPDNLLKFIENTFVDVSVFRHLLNVQASFSVASEFTLLSHPDINGLGGTKHQLLLRTVIEELCESVSECLYSLCSWGADKAKDFAAELYPVLRAVPLAEKFTSGSLAAWCCLIRLSSYEVLTRATSSAGVLGDMVREIRNETLWTDQSVCGTVQLACAIAIRSMALSPSDLMSTVNVEIDVDKVFDRAIQNFALKFLRLGIIGSECFTQSSAHFRVVDTLLKQLICHFPAKLMEIERNSEDELSWAEELSTKGQKISPHLHYATFLGCLCDIYFFIDSPRLPTAKKDELIEMSRSFSTVGSMELCRFLERGRMVCHPVHAVQYLEMQRAVCRSQETAVFLYDVFARVPGNQDVYIGWEQFMAALRTYEQMFRQSTKSIPFGGNPTTLPPVIPSQELAGLISWIKLATAISEHDEEGADAFIQEPTWAAIDCCCGLIVSPVPLELKGALLSLLSAFASRETAISRIWHSLEAHQICYFEGGALCGLQHELDERECAAKKYDTTVGMVHLLNALLTHGTVPDFAAPYIQFLTRSVISQMRSRSYDNVHQMWDIAETSLDTVHSMIKNSYTDTRSVAQKDTHVQLLVQILNDTPVYRALCEIFAEDCDAYVNPAANSGTTRVSQDTALSALRLLALAVSRHSQLRSSVRSAASDIIIANLPVLLQQPLRHSGESVLDILFLYLDQIQELPCHAFHATCILKELCAIRPSLQKKMTDLLRIRMRANHYAGAIGAVWKVLDFGKIEYSVDNVIVSGHDDSDPVLCRGETARMLLEILSDAIDTDPSGPNLCFLLFGFQKNIDGRLFASNERKTGFHNLIALLESFDTSRPFNKPYAALFEPAFRLLKRLVSVDCVFSTSVLRYLRSNEFILRILESGSLISCINQFDMADSPTESSLVRMIAGSILHLAAIETSSLLKNGQLDMPRRLYKNLFDKVDVLDETTMDEDGNSSNILFSILRNSRSVVTPEVEFIPLDHFNSQKLQIISKDCKTTTTFGIPQYDIEGLHELLKREISSTQNEQHLVVIAEKEMTQVLEYFTDLNRELLLRGAVDSLVSGCTSVLNVVALFSPVPFFSIETQLDLLCDASFAVIEFSSDCTDKSSIPLCATLLRLSKAVCTLAKEEYKDLDDLRTVIGRLFVPLLEFLVLPSEKPFQSKISLYESLRLCLKTCYSQQKSHEAIPQPAQNWLNETTASPSEEDVILSCIHRVSYELSNRLVSDTGDMPFETKVHPLLLLSDILFEDAKGSKKVAAQFSKSGMPRYIVDLLSSVEIDWAALSRRDAAAQTSHRLFNTILVLLIRLSLTDSGWTALSELAAPEILARLSVITNPPKEIFLKPESVNTEGSPAQFFSHAVGLIMHLCLSLCAKPRWKRLSFKILDVVKAIGEILSQLTRAEIQCAVVKNCADLVHHIWECDDNAKSAIDSDPLLNSLRTRRSRQPQPALPASGPVAFNAPTSLLRTLFAPAV